MIFIMHMVVMLELTLRQREKNLLSAALFEWHWDMFIQQWVKNVMKMAKKPCVNDGLGEN